MRQIKVKKPLTIFAIYFFTFLIVIVIGLITDILRCSTLIQDLVLFIAICIWIFDIHVFHLATAPLTKHLIFSRPFPKTIEIHMIFHNLGKEITPSMKAKVLLMEEFTTEFLTAMDVLQQKFPDYKFKTYTWLVPEKDRKFLEDHDVHVKKHLRGLGGLISEFYELNKGNQKISKNIRTLWKHKNYKYKWNKAASERILTDLKKPEMRNILRN